MPPLSVIIPAYVSAPDVLADVLRCVQSVRSTTDPAQVEIIVQDDASPAMNLVPLLGPICERNAQNRGFPGNCNAGAARASGDLLLFLNQDAWITQRDWVARLLDFFAQVPQTGIVGPTLLFPDGCVQSVGGGFDGARQPYHIALGARNPGWAPISRPRPVAWITGAALAIRTELWRELGGFDPAYGRGYFEDVDLCLRASQLDPRLAGTETWHYPGIRFWHRVGSTGGSARFQQNARLFKARWVDSDVIEPDTAALKEHFWA